MSTASIELQRAIVAALRADPALIAEVSGIFDGPDAGRNFPYVTIDPDLVTENSTKTTRARVHRFSLTVWADSAALSAVKPALARIEAVISDLMAIGGGHDLVTINFVRSSVRRDVNDGLVRGTCEFLARTQV